MFISEAESHKDNSERNAELCSPPRSSAKTSVSAAVNSFFSQVILRLARSCSRRLNQRRIQLDVRSRQSLRHGTILLRRLRLFEKSCFIDAGHFAFGVEFNSRDLEAFANLLETDAGLRANSRRIVTGLRQSRRQRHRKTSGMRRADQLLRIRPCAFFEPRREGILTFKSAAA